MDDLLAACRILDGERLTDAFGHVSTRDGQDHALITPHVGPGLVQDAADLLRLRLSDGAVVGGDASLLPGEAALHRAVYLARPDVGAVCRFHGRAAMAWGTLGRPLEPAIGFGLLVGVIPVHETAGPVRDPEDAAAAARTLGNGAGILLRGFGALCVGRHVAETTVRATWLERSADASLRAGTPLPYDAGAIARFQSATAMIDEQVGRAWAYLRSRHAGG